jgi:hypothetical protein
MHKGQTDEPKGDYGCQFGCQFRESGGTVVARDSNSGVARFTHIVDIYILLHRIYVSFFFLFLLSYSSNQIIRKKSCQVSFQKIILYNKRFRLLPSDTFDVFSLTFAHEFARKKKRKRTKPTKEKKSKKEERKKE